MINEKLFAYGKHTSVIRELYEYGLERKEKIGKENVFDFTLGNPSVPSPKEVNEGIIDLVKNMDSVELHGYTPAKGDKKVRFAVADYLQKTYGADITGDHVYICMGAAACLSITMTALINPGEELIIFAPYYPEYRVFSNTARPKIVEVQPDLKTFLPDLEDFEKKITPNTAMVLYNSPNNPTGVVYNEEFIIKLTNILKRKQKEYGHPIYLVSDEPYRELVFNGTKYPFITNYYDNAVVNYSFSKSLSLPGERIGYIAISSKMQDADKVYKTLLGAGRSMGFICAGTLFQYLIPKVQGYTSDLSVYKENRDLLTNMLTEIGYECIPSDGAFYLFVKSLEPDANHFAKVAAGLELLLVPSNSFGIGGYVRIAYCVSKETILASKDAFTKLYNIYKGEK